MMDFARLRLRMVSEQIEARGITHPNVLEAMRRVPRHEFVPLPQLSRAYDDTALPIGLGATISQPYIVGLMTSLLDPIKNSKILEIGTGSGYQAAVLAELGAKVFSIEVYVPHSRQAKKNLARLGYLDRIQLLDGEGSMGWSDHAPFDAALITCAVTRLPPDIVHQLRTGGKIVAPVGNLHGPQTLKLFVKNKTGFLESRDLEPVIFVPMIGPHEK